MPDITDDLRALLRDRAEEAPAVPEPGGALVTRVRRRRAVNATALVAGPALAVAAIVAVAANLAGPARDAARPVTPSPVPSLAGDKYELCHGEPAPALDVSIHDTEMTFAQGCHVVRAGFDTVTFRNVQTLPHNVAIRRENAAIEDGALWAGEVTMVGKPEDHPTGVVVTVTSMPIAFEAGDYELFCQVHPLMQSQLVVR